MKAVILRVARHTAALGLLALAASSCGDSSPTGSAVSEAALTPAAATAGVALGSTVAGRIAPGGSYNLRSGPGTGFAVVGTIAGGTQVSITCQAYGTTHTGPWGTTNIWDRLSTGAWITDAYVYTGRNGLVAPLCGSTAPPGIVPGVRGDNYPYRNDPRVFNPGGCVADEWAFCKRNCTSFVAHRLNRVNGVPFANRFRSTTSNPATSGGTRCTGRTARAGWATPSTGRRAWATSRSGPRPSPCPGGTSPGWPR